ncbi:bacterial Ig-like domain-containing protein [Lactococcus lactis]|uniref:bacterial Ig-like domain-containing protein n=1 Tax=Lactococcus lactis TaxID=1358 RepID=UPI0024A81B9C|nr:bacterial Ig-like domain-containing protein [Lactococcus lactis]
MSTIMLGALAPTGQGIAETVPLEKDAPNVVQSEPSTSSSSSNKSKISEGSTSSSSLSISNNSSPLKKSDLSAVPSTSSTPQSAGAIKNDDIKKSTTILKETGNISKQSYENVEPGDLGKQLFDEGIQNARANNDKSLGDKLMQKDWSEIREAGLLFQGGLNYLGPQPKPDLGEGGTTGNGIVWAGDVYVGLRDSHTKEFISSINVFSLDKSKIPTSSEISEMGLEESARYNMPKDSDKSLEPQEYFDYLVDNNIQIDISPLITAIPEQITPKSPTANSDVKRTDITAVVSGIYSNSSLTHYPVGTSFIFDDELSHKFPNGSIKTYSLAETPKKQGLYLPVQASDPLYTLGVKAKTKSTDKLIFFGGREDERINNPSTLVDLDNLADNSGRTIDGSKVNISWEIAPDTTQKTNDGSGVLKIDASAVNTGSSKYKDGITYLRVPYIVKEIQPVLVKYINEEGNSIHGDQTIIPSNEGDPYDASTSTYKLNDIAGTDGVNYHLDTTKLPANATGAFGEEPVTVTYTYKKDQTAMNVHNSTIYVGDSWTSKDNWDSTLNIDGESVDFAEVEKNGKIEGSVDTTTAGTYEVTYTYQGVTESAVIIVKDKQTAMNVHDSTIYVGDDWKAEDNFDSAVDKDGNAIDFSKLTVDDSKKDTSKAGTFEVTYSYDGVTSTAKITVKDHNSVPVIPDKPKATIPPTHATSSIGKGTKTSTKSKVTSKSLPKTGEKTGWILTGSGFSIMLLLIAYLLTKTKRNNK